MSDRDRNPVVVNDAPNPDPDLVPAMVMTPEDAKKRLGEFQRFIDMVMVEGVDYGVIPGTSGKKTLLKPGAEKLLEIYGFTPEFSLTEAVQQWGANPPFFHFIVECRISSRRTGRLIAEGMGSANSREKRYGDRWVSEREVPDGVDLDLLRSREYDGRYGPYRKYLVPNEETADLHNTILKMACKRAMVDATLHATRSSGIFTQDVEDLDPALLQRDKPVGKAEPPRREQPQQTGQRAAAGDEQRATPPQVKAIYAVARNQKGLTEPQVDDQVEKSYGCKPAELTRRQASEMITTLQSGGVPAAKEPQQTARPASQPSAQPDLFPEGGQTSIAQEMREKITSRLAETKGVSLPKWMQDFQACHGVAFADADVDLLTSTWEEMQRKPGK